MARNVGVVLCALTFLLGMPTGEAESAMSLAKVFLIPFGVTTYIPVTRGDIESQSFFRILLVAEDGAAGLHPLVRRLQVLLESHPTNRRLDENFIRLKVELPGQTYYVDGTGVVLRHSTGQTFQLGQPEKKRIEELIGGLQGVIDAKAVTRVDSANFK